MSCDPPVASVGPKLPTLAFMLDEEETSPAVKLEACVVQLDDVAGSGELDGVAVADIADVRTEAWEELVEGCNVG